MAVRRWWRRLDRGRRVVPKGRNRSLGRRRRNPAGKKLDGVEESGAGGEASRRGRRPILRSRTPPITRRVVP
jgi:hypothetical protein